MDDYLDALYHYLTEERLPKAPLPADYAAQEQRRLFHAYDDARTAFAAASEDAYVRQVFLLAREIYR